MKPLKVNYAMFWKHYLKSCNNSAKMKTKGKLAMAVTSEKNRVDIRDKLPLTESANGRERFSETW